MVVVELKWKYRCPKSKSGHPRQGDRPTGERKRRDKTGPKTYDAKKHVMVLQANQKVVMRHEY